MVNKIIISHFNSLAAISKSSRVQELVFINRQYQVNDIYIGSVQKIFSSLNAAFINLGECSKSGFIHISDIKNLKRGKKSFLIRDYLSTNQLLLVQIVKEPTYNKGPRLTSNIHLYGKYIVLMPFCNTVLISNQIYDKNERIYLHSLALLAKPEGMGVIVKSSAQGVSEALILYDLDLLIKQWYFIQKKTLVSSVPSVLYKDEDLIKKVIRDVYDSSIKKIVVDSEYSLKLVYYYLKKWFYISVTTNTKLQLYNKDTCILDRFSIKYSVKNLLNTKVNLLYGGYLFIENYEALTIIDVNSGSFNKLYSSQETILRINFYAAIEIAYQLKARNINGVVIIDFIDMNSQRDQLKLIDHLNKLLIYDQCSPQVIELSSLGLLQLTRRRRNKSLREMFHYSNLKKIYSCNFFYINDLYLKLFFYVSGQESYSQYLLNKNIRSLFFSKQFKFSRALSSKLMITSVPIFNKYFIFMDYKQLLRFFYPRANYIVPLIFYSKLTKTKL